MIYYYFEVDENGMSKLPSVNWATFCVSGFNRFPENVPLSRDEVLDVIVTVTVEASLNS